MEAEAQRVGALAASGDAMDLYFQGRAFWNKGMTPEYLAQATGFFERALALDDGYVDAPVGWAVVLATIAVRSPATNRPADQVGGGGMALTRRCRWRRAHTGAYLALGAAQVFENQRRCRASPPCDGAGARPLYLADAHGLLASAWPSILTAARNETEAHGSREALRLSPLDVHVLYRWLRNTPESAKARSGAETAQAADWLRRSIEANRNFPLAHFRLAGALAWLGQIDEAEAVREAGLALQAETSPCGAIARTPWALTTAWPRRAATIRGQAARQVLRS